MVSYSVLIKIYYLCKTTSCLTYQAALFILTRNHAIDFRKIVELKKTREDIANLVEYERGLSRPVLKDFSLVEVMYRIFKDILSQRDCAPDIESVTQRKKFVFITLLSFLPRCAYRGLYAEGAEEGIIHDARCKERHFHIE